jgi:hypothetical protein
MMKGCIVLVGLLTFVVSPASAKEFWVAQDAATKKCDIVNEKPDGATKIMIGTTSYATKEEANAARAKTTAEECPHKPSSSAFAKEFWVAQDAATKECDIVHEKPDGHTRIMIGTTSYATRDEAKAARAKTTAEECPRKPSSP